MKCSFQAISHALNLNYIPKLCIMRCEKKTEENQKSAETSFKLYYTKTEMIS